MNDPQSLGLDFVADDTLSGRLQRLEVLNWGTFDRHVWTRCSSTAATGCSPATSARASPPWSMRSPRRSSPPTASPTTRPPAPAPASTDLRSLRARPLQVRAQRDHRRRAPDQPARARQLLGDPRRVPQRRLRQDREPGPGVLVQGGAGPARTLLPRRRARAVDRRKASRPGPRHHQLRKRLRGAGAGCSTASRPTPPGSAAASASTTSRRSSSSTRPCR